MPANKANKVSKSVKSESIQKSKMSKSSKKTPVEKSEVVEPVVVEPVVDQTTETTETNNVDDWKEVGQSLIDRLDQCLQKSKESQKEYETEVKEISKELKQFMKRTGKEVRRKKQKGGNANRAPSGFAKPANISDELAMFLGVEKGTMLARTDVTKRLTTYIKEHDLQNPDNKRQIFPDEKLGKIIKIPEKYNDQLTYFNFQACFKHHFASKDHPLINSSA
ncbi:SWIB/MDM2 domain-containing protein [bacterium]|nr:SWIB/MDM2 domain-containing protein [bacterium]